MRGAISEGNLASPADAKRSACDPPGRWSALAVLSVATFLGMACWFSASAVLPQLRTLWALSPSAGAWLTIAVQLGFVAGALVSAVFNLADLVPPRRLMLWGCVGGAIANGLIAAGGGYGVVLGLRFLTGAALALVYPPGLKAIATWFRKERGTALGVMVGALTLGSALPHLVNALGGVEWRWVIVVTSALTLLGGLLAEIGGTDGPFPFPRPIFNPRQAGKVLADRGVRLACLGYFGHMWELYAMWAWIAAFALDRAKLLGLEPARVWGSGTAFAAIGIGGLGCWVGGRLGDRWGRAKTAALCMAISGACALLVAWPALPPWATLTLALVWGFWVVADSAQFSTLVTEVADQAYVGTAVTLQLAIGFTLTVVTIWLVPLLRDAWGWHSAFAVLALGPLLGIGAMRALDRGVAGPRPTALER